MSKAERTRQFIIEQTAPVFNKRGYAGTSLSDLTQATGLTKGAIYGNFANKEDVALAAFDYNIGLIQPGLQAGLHSTASARERLLATPRFFRAGFRHLCAAGGCPILNAATETDDAPPAALQQRVQHSLQQWCRNLASIIEQGQERGEIRAEADARRYAALFVALVEGSELLAKTLNDVTFLDTALDHIEQLIDNELLA